MDSPRSKSGVPERQLSLWDCTCILVGVVVGAGIHETTPQIASEVTSVGWLYSIWILGGFFALAGALCYAELATTYSEDGGDYVYLSRAFGRRAGFLYSWAQFWVVRPGSIGAMAFIFARYANRLCPLDPVVPHLYGQVIYAAGSIGILSALNMLSMRQSKRTQNALTTCKVFGLLAIVAIAMIASADPTVRPETGWTGGSPDFRLALVLVMFTYGGWNDMSFIAAEVRDPRRNTARALLLGTSAIVGIYLLVTWAFLQVLGFEGVQSSPAVSAETVEAVLGPWGDRSISILICISCLGAVQGMIFTGARIYYAAAADHRMFAWMGNWSQGAGSPTRAILLQTAVTLAIVIVFGFYENGFQRMVVFTTPVFWLFFLLTGISLFVLRHTDPDAPRSFRVPGYPITPLIFCGSSLLMLWCGIDWAIQNKAPEAFWAIGILLGGVGISLAERRT